MSSRKRSSQRRSPQRATFLWLALIGLAFWIGRETGLREEIVRNEAPGFPVEFIEPKPKSSLLGPCRVLRIIDGDTVDVDCGELKDRVRLLRIDTPERKEPGFSAAKAALRGLIDNREIFLDFEEPGELKRGKYGRVLAYLQVDGRNLNLEMVRMGWTGFYTRFGTGRFGTEFERAQREARSARRGIWGMQAN